MKQIAQTQRDGKLQVIDVPSPALRQEGVLVRTAFSLISAGTERVKVEVAKKNLVGKALARPDQVRQVIQTAQQIGLAATYQKVKTKLDSLSPLGYSSAGVVVAVGARAEGFAPGDHVACAGGGYANHAEIAYVPRNLCAHVPSGVGLDEASFATVGAIALQGVRQTAPTLGETIGVIGLGLLGLITVQLVRAAGCRVVGLDVNPARCELARQLGADVATTPNYTSLESLASHYSPGGLDAVILTAATKSSDPIILAGKLSRDRGRIVVVGAVGMDIPRSPFYEKELEVRLSRSYGPGRYDPGYEEKGIDYPVGYVRWTEGRNLSAFMDLIAQRKVDVNKLITHRFVLDDAEKAYDVIEGKTSEPYLGVLLDYGLRASEIQHPSQENPIRLWSVPSGSDKIGLAFIGAGNFAQSMLLPPLKTNTQVLLRTVVTSSGLSARSVADRGGFEQCASDPDVVFNDSNIRLVVIASRHNSHAELTARALQAGKAVFVEKPLALSQEQLDQVVSAYRQSESRNAPSPFLMVGFNRRFAPLMIKAREFMAGTREPLLVHYRVNAGFIHQEHWTQDVEEGGGRILGEVCHFVDLILYLVNQPLVQVYANALPDLGRYSQDNLSVTLRFADGSVGTILYAANGNRGLEKERLEIFSGGRIAVLDDFKQLALVTNEKKMVSKASPDKGHRSEMQALVEAVRHNAPSPIPFEQLVMTTQATMAILESLGTGMPVQVNV